MKERSLTGLHKRWTRRLRLNEEKLSEMGRGVGVTIEWGGCGCKHIAKRTRANRLRQAFILCAVLQTSHAFSLREVPVHSFMSVRPCIMAL
jgi:hypothetical protein